MSDVLGPLLQRAVRASEPVDVTAILGQMLQMGDEAHNRNRAGTLMLLRDLGPALVTSGGDAADVAETLRFVGGNDHFFLNLAMPACKLALDAARDHPGSTMVVAMSRNGTDFGIQVSGTGDEWFTGPAQVADGLYLGDYGPDDANPDIGDSAITETAGLGGFAMATAPAIVRLVGGSVPDALATTRRMREITLGDNPRWSIPVLEFAGVPTGIDVSAVCRTGILPQINTGMAGRAAGVGQVGAGLVTPPAEIFPAALGSPGSARPSAGGRQNACRCRRRPRAAAACPPRGSAAGRSSSWLGGSDPSARTTRHHGTGPPCAAITAPTSRGRRRPTAPTTSAIAPYVVTRPRGISSTTDSTSSTYSSWSSAHRALTSRSSTAVAGATPRPPHHERTARPATQYDAGVVDRAGIDHEPARAGRDEPQQRRRRTQRRQRPDARAASAGGPYDAQHRSDVAPARSAAAGTTRRPAAVPDRQGPPEDHQQHATRAERGLRHRGEAANRAPGDDDEPARGGRSPAGPAASSATGGPSRMTARSSSRRDSRTADHRAPTPARGTLARRASRRSTSSRVPPPRPRRSPGSPRAPRPASTWSRSSRRIRHARSASRGSIAVGHPGRGAGGQRVDHDHGQAPLDAGRRSP